MTLRKQQNFLRFDVAQNMLERGNPKTLYYTPKFLHKPQHIPYFDVLVSIFFSMISELVGRGYFASVGGG